MPLLEKWFPRQYRRDPLIYRTGGKALCATGKLVGHRVVAHVNAAAAQGRKIIEKITYDIQDYHASPVEAAETAAAADVDFLLYYHIVPALPVSALDSLWLEGVSDVYDGTVGLGVGGSFVSAIACGLFGYPDAGLLFFGVGFFSIIVMESVILTRLLAHGIPVALRATMGIHLAPPAVGSVASVVFSALLAVASLAWVEVRAVMSVDSSENLEVASTIGSVRLVVCFGLVCVVVRFGSACLGVCFGSVCLVVRFGTVGLVVCFGFICLVVRFGFVLLLALWSWHYYSA